MNMLDQIKRDLGPYWAHEGRDVNLYARTFAHLLADAEKGPPVKVEQAMREANVLLKGHGVEAIRDEKHNRWFWGESRLLYVNMGDPYVATLLYDIEAQKFLISGWADWLEAYEREHGALP